MKSQNFLIIGAGIFGISTAYELAKRSHQVTVINSGTIPHPEASSTDINKAIRFDYGSDLEYMKMAIQAMDRWNQWNERLAKELYHENGYLLLSKDQISLEGTNFESRCYKNIVDHSFEHELLDEENLKNNFPAFKESSFKYGLFNPRGGFAESGKAVEQIANYIKKIGVQIIEGKSVENILSEKNTAIGVQCFDHEVFHADHVIVCAGSSTPYLLPELKTQMKITGHPLFHIQASRPHLYNLHDFPTFSADISNTGWYGFPFHPKEKVVKIALHSEGLELNPLTDERKVYENDIENLRQFLEREIPSLRKDPIVFTRRCCYTDTLDGHFWIDRHPEIKNLTVGSGGSGHGFKMGPIVGEMIAQKALGENHAWSDRFAWRTLNTKTKQEEEARYKPQI